MKKFLKNLVVGAGILYFMLLGVWSWFCDLCIKVAARLSAKKRTTG